MKKSIFVLSVLLFVSGLFLPVCRAETWRGCVSDTLYPNTKYNYIVEAAATYFAIRGTVVNTNSTSRAFPGHLVGYIESTTGMIHLTAVYRNNFGARIYIIDRSGAGISWAVDATGAIYDPAHAVQLKACPAADNSSKNPAKDIFNLGQGNR
ncbi:MAG: hypothetical protein HQK56_02880 [Deltaproteobacteria bacterium]|nr:hypothetical protein [Deltaproteobacteria bacterium]